MTFIVPTSQSDIAEVRDQLSVDFADGKYLNVISANLGLERPSYGFSDATWRALVRVLGLQYKQISTKFEEILTIVLGPKITQVGALAEDTAVGAEYAVLVNTEQFPQVGTMVLDEGLASEETVEYTFIDRYTKVVYFATPLTHPHTAVGQTWESGIISDVATAATNLNVFDTSGFPDVVSPFTVNLGRGTAAEAVTTLTALVRDARKLTVSSAPGELPGATAASGMLVTQSGGPTQAQVHYLTMLSVEALRSADGWLQSGELTSLTATAGSTITATVAGPLSVSRYGGFWVRFDGNITAALENAVGFVEDNTSTVFTFGNTLPASPAAGDTFSVITNFQYINANSDDNSVLMRRELPDLLTFPASCQFTVMRPSATVAIAQVQVKGAGWDVFQSDPRHVEILLPRNLIQHTPRTASYIREVGLSGSTAIDAVGSIGDEEISVVDATLMPLTGVLEHTPSSARYFYFNPQTTLTADAAVGDTVIYVVDTSEFPASGSIDIAGVSTTYTVADATSMTVAALPSAVRITDVVREANILKLGRPLTGAVALTDGITYYSDFDSGDLWEVADVWPGPYVWDFVSHTPKEETVPGNTATTVLPGPTFLAVDRVVNATVFELEDASAFSTAVPYDVRLGENSGNVETLSVQQLSLRSRTYEEVTTTPVTAGDTTVQLGSLAGPTGPANGFPNGGPYRVVLSPFTANQEVVEVISTDGVDTLNLSAGTVNSHVIGSAAVLLADLIRVSPAAGDDHAGRVKYADRFGLYAPEHGYANADMVRPLHTSLTLSLAPTDFPVTETDVFLNFGNATLAAESELTATIAGGVSAFVLTSTADFPTTGYPYVVYVDVGAGPLREERLHVTNNNTGTGTLTVSHPTVFGHSAARAVQFRPGIEEVISYTTRVGSVLNSVPYLTLLGTHYTMEHITPSSGTGYPRDNGFDFPLRMPVTLEDRVRYVIDLVRAAGVEVTFVVTR